MRLALVNGQRAEPSPNLKGACSHCGADMVAKCGRVKVWHWAHKGRLKCDPWWENETEWHRAWKNRFPLDWQEIGQIDPLTGERHIADVKTPHGLVVEFQHSILHPDELAAREKFYGEMIWIVDGLRGELDGSFFNMGRSSSPIQNDPLAYQIDWYGRGRLLHNWGQSSKKVYLDFGDQYLWRLVFFDNNRKRGAVGPIFKDAVVEDCLNGTPIRVLTKGGSEQQ